MSFQNQFVFSPSNVKDAAVAPQAIQDGRSLVYDLILPQFNSSRNQSWMSTLLEIFSIV